MLSDFNLNLLKNLISQGGIIAFFSFILSRVRLFRNIFQKPSTTISDKFILVLFFSGLGIIGTYTGIPVNGAIANTRVVGVFVGGLIGGPVVGIFSGIIAGGHRFLIDQHGFTAMACMISTIAEGCFASILHKSFIKSPNKWIFATLYGMIAEILQMIIIFMVAKPLNSSLELLKIIGIPMIVGNGLAIGMFIALADSFFREREKIAAIQAQKILKITQESLPFLRQGYNYITAYKTAKIIYKELNLAAVSFTTTEGCLTHIGIGHDHHIKGSPLKTLSTQRVIANGKTYVANIKREIDCSNHGCNLKSAVISPLFSNNRVIGTLKLYRSKEYSITEADVETASGLASLFSIQIENSRIEEHKRLLQNSELKALQSQINPHFLFNAINTVSSFIRTKPEKARNLLLDLSDYYRLRLHDPDKLIPLSCELDHVKAYLDIERARFEDRLEVIFTGKTDDTTPVPPLIVQPIVENAVKHGVLKSINKGIVTISIESRKDLLTISVEDNGIGIEAKKLKSLLCECNGSVGLVNVHKRLLNLYGENGGLKIESKQGKGTKVCLRIPLMQ